jgi:hypothetical protein
MERIGIAASKMAKGNLWTYNVFVVMISCLCALLVFLICGFSILAALFLISLVFRFFMPSGFNAIWFSIVKLCLLALAVVVGLLNLVAIIKNMKLKKYKL